MKFAYLSGYIDGDGCICCRVYTQKPSIKVYECSLQICSVDKQICTYFIDEFKGAFHQRPEKENRRDAWLWYIKGNGCKKILESCLPYLILKRKSSAICCDLIQEISETRCHIGKKVSIKSHEYRKELICQIKKEIHMNDRVNEENFQSLKEIKKTKIASSADLAYLSGLIDAEGCFRIQHWKSKREGRNEDWVISLEIGNTKFPIFPWLLERFGGSVFYRKPTTSRHNPMIIWSLRSNALYQILNSIYPFLRNKKERCQKLEQFYQTRIPNGGDRKSKAFREHVVNLCVIRRQLFDEFQILNKKGKH